MKKFIFALLIFLLAPLSLCATARNVSVSSHGWTVSLDKSGNTLSIASDSMGVLLRDVHLFRQQPQGRIALTGWSVTTEGNDRLRIETAQPRSTWVFSLEDNVLRISTTEPNGVLVAHAPAPPDRPVVRLMDNRGTPVEWAGNSEVVSTYGGTNTTHRSFLPQKNAETMFFSLGLVSGSNFHSLFDRKTDTAIDFEPGTEMQRGKGTPDVLDVTLPAHGNSRIRLLPDYYTKTLGVPFYVEFDDRYFPSAPMVWSSWTSYYEAVTEQDMVRNSDGVYPFTERKNPFAINEVRHAHSTVGKAILPVGQYVQRTVAIGYSDARFLVAIPSLGSV